MIRLEQHTASARPARFGYSLVEVLVVVAIVGILAAISYPSYQAQIRSSRRTEAQSLLLDIWGRQEEFFADNRTFTANMVELGFDDDPALSENGFYQADAVAGETADIATSFIATATRLGTQTADTRCYDFTIDSEGNRRVTNYPGFDDDPPAAPPDGCW
jgi:type IV pilus assembly protein PilE